MSKTSDNTDTSFCSIIAVHFRAHCLRGHSAQCMNYSRQTA